MSIHKIQVTRTYAVSISYQAEYDPDDGTGAGYYAWVGPPDDQSDFVIGPCASRERAEELAHDRAKRVYASR